MMSCQPLQIIYEWRIIYSLMLYAQNQKRWIRTMENTIFIKVKSQIITCDFSSTPFTSNSHDSLFFQVHNDDNIRPVELTLQIIWLENIPRSNILFGDEIFHLRLAEQPSVRPIYCNRSIYANSVSEWLDRRRYSTTECAVISSHRIGPDTFGVR